MEKKEASKHTGSQTGLLLQQLRQFQKTCFTGTISAAELYLTTYSAMLLLPPRSFILNCLYTPARLLLLNSKQMDLMVGR